MTFRSLRIASTLLCTLPLIWTACGGSDTPGSAGSAAATTPSLTDTEWKLVAFESSGGEAITPDPTAVPTITFVAKASHDGGVRMAGFSGCNPFFGEYTAGDDGSLSIPAPLGMAQAACSDAIMSLEAAVMKSLAGATSYSLGDDGLTIHSTNGPLRFSGG